MRALDRALVRELWKLRGQVLATALVLACGVAIFVAMLGTWRALANARDGYYRSHRFPDVFAPLTRAPRAVEAELAAVPGVASVQARVVSEAVLDVPGLAEPARGLLVGIDPVREPVLNGLFLRAGRLPAGGRLDEVVVSEAFAAANGLAPGAALEAVVGGRLRALAVVGVGISPEFIYELGSGALFPDNRRYGVLWVDGETLATAVGQEGGFNDVALALAPGASEAAVIRAVDRVLEPYGGLGAYGREDHPSHRFISDEIAQNRVTATWVPAIFLGVGVFLVHTILTRLVALQRTQIGTLKAFGYTDYEVMAHYARLALAMVAIGAALGAATGAWMGSALTRLYADFYHFPSLVFAPGARTWALLAALVVGAGLSGAASAVGRVARLAPAQAMRAQSPASFRHGLVDGSRLGRALPPAARMVLRSLARHPWKASLTVAGMACGLGLLVLSGVFHDALRTMMRVQFEVMQREDATVAFREALGPEALLELERLPGVLRVEPLREAPARLTAGHRSRRLALSGLDPGGELRRLVDRDLRRVRVPPEGVVLSAKLAQLLAVEPGDELAVEFLEGRRARATVRVTGRVDDYVGLGAYMDASALQRLAGEGERYSGALLRVDPAQWPVLNAELKRLPALSGAVSREATVRSFEEIVARTMFVTLAIEVLFACLIAAGLVYNGARIALSERAGELATLRVLGFTRAETARLLLSEQALLTAAGVPVGLALGAAVSLYLGARLSTDLYRMPVVFSPRTLLAAVLVILAAAALSGILVAWRVRRLDLVGVLKARE